MIFSLTSAPYSQHLKSKKGSVLGSVSVLYESGAGGRILIGLLFFLVLCIGKRKFYGYAPVLWDFTVQFQPAEAFWATQFGPTHQAATNPLTPIPPPASPHQGITFYLERVIIIQNDMILVSAFRCNREGTWIKQKCAQFVCRFASSLHGSCFFMQVQERKKEQYDVS